MGLVAVEDGPSQDDGTCLAPHPSAAGVRCGRKAGHGPGDMHDSGFFGGVPCLWPNLARDE